MKKAKWRKFITAGAIVLSLGMAVPFTSIQAEECPVEVASEGDISTYADEYIMYYRIYKGRRQKRLWNRTQGEWADKKWTDLGPA